MREVSMPFRRLRRACPASIFIVVLLVAALVPLVRGGQDNLGRGRISGKVVDPAGRPVEGATVTAQSLEGNAKLDGKTDKKGNFAIIGLGTGTWRIMAAKPGYADASIEMGITQLKANPPINFKLQKLTGVEELRADKSALSAIDKGNQLARQGDFDGAIAVFREFLAEYPELYPVRLNIAEALLNKGDADGAEAEYKGLLEKILQVHGDYAKDKSTAVKALSGLGETALKKGDLEAGRTYLSQALALSPEDEAAAYNVGDILFSNQKVDEAIEFFQLAARIKSTWPKPYYKLGFAYLNKGDYANALESFNKFIALDPENPEIPTVKNIVATIEKIKK
jgi:tetratricopeptide (TPR) repeat protein